MVKAKRIHAGRYEYKGYAAKKYVEEAELIELK